MGFKILNVESVFEIILCHDHVEAWDSITNGLRDTCHWHSYVTWSYSSCSFSTFWSKIASKGAAAGSFDLWPCWSSVSLKFAPLSSWWAEHWELCWIRLEKWAALILWLSFVRKDFWLPETIKLASSLIDWDWGRHFLI